MTIGEHFAADDARDAFNALDTLLIKARTDRDSARQHLTAANTDRDRLRRDLAHAHKELADLRSESPHVAAKYWRQREQARAETARVRRFINAAWPETP